MNESAIVSPLIREYVTKHKIEEILNEAINKVLRELPDDPFSQLSSFVLSVLNSYLEKFTHV
jgi:hypothetical protein